MNPYQKLLPNAFWKTAVAEKSMFDVNGLWEPKFKIEQTDNVATYGSCFAQHIGRALKARNFNWLITENEPYGLSEDNLQRFNYQTFTSRTGNIYTKSLLTQWTRWAAGKETPPDEIWQQDKLFYDPFRPRIEPNGYASVDEVLATRAQTIDAFKSSIERANYFVFTLGLTESWTNAEFGYEYPMCPGTAAGKFEESAHKFSNQQFSTVLKNLVESIDLMRSMNSNLRFILTVSPVPLVATKSNQHVLVATMLSKSILRAVAGQLAANRGYVDYFPSYEIINSPVFKGVFFEPNQRSVNPHGVNFVMDSFFECLRAKYGDFLESEVPHKPASKEAICEEQLLDAFGKQP